MIIIAMSSGTIVMSGRDLISTKVMASSSKTMATEVAKLAVPLAGILSYPGQILTVRPVSRADLKKIIMMMLQTTTIQAMRNPLLPLTLTN